MRKKWIYVAMLVLSFSLAAAACNEQTGNGGSSGEDVYEDYKPEKEPSDGQFDHDGNYAAPELKIDGKGDDEQWQAIKEPLATFGNGNAATVKAYRGNDALFFFFEVQDKILLTEGETNDDAVTRSDSIEFYLDTLADGGLKPQSDDYQINLGIHGKTRIMQGSGSGWGNWNGLIDYEVSLKGTLNDGVDANDEGYSVEVMIPYKQINIEKDDTIAISFGQVDKVGAGNAATVDWDWHPWIYNGVVTEPQTPNNYVLLDKDNALMARDEEKKPNAEMAGYVLDSATSLPIVGATVSVEIGGKTQTATTDESGFFSFANVDPEGTYTVVIEKDGYIGNTATYTRAELRAANGGRVQKDITIIDEDVVARTKLTGTIKNLLDGAIGGATVRIEGTVFETTADENGVFEIAEVPVEEDKDVTIVVSKAGYGESKTFVKYEELITDGEGITALGDVNLNRPYAETGAFGGKSDFFADSSMKISRALDGVEFYLTGTRKLTGHIEVYVDTKGQADHRDNDENFWCFNLRDSGMVDGNHYAGGAFSAEGLEYTLYHNDSNGYSARFFVPYTYLGITPFEVFGISLGQWSTAANDWDGWGFAGQFVKPETPETLIRLSATNELYRANNNVSMVNLSGNVGIQGVRVSIGDTFTTSGADGSWNMKIPSSAEAVELVYSCLGYETRKTTIEAGYFNTHYSFHETLEMNVQTVSIAGVVTDSITGAPVEGVVVTIEGTSITATTDGEGRYALNGVSTSKAIQVVFAKDGYATQTKDLAAEVLAGAAAHTLDVSFVSNEQVKYVVLTGTVTNVNGGVQGVTVTVEGTPFTATTDENGVWTINDFKCVDGTIVFAKEGYISQSVAFKADGVDSAAERFSVGGVDMPLEFVNFGALEEKPDETKRQAFAGFTAYVTRTATAFEFKFIGKRAFANGPFEFYFDLGASDKRDYQFIFRPDGSLTVNHFTGTNTSTAALIWSMKNVETAAEIYLTVPYTFLGVSATDIIGVGAGQWSDAVADWDGMFSHGAYVEVNDPATGYVRLTSYNDFYRHTSNDKIVHLSGNAGMEGVTVTFGGVSVTTDKNGAWSMRASMPSGESVVTYSKQGYLSQTATVQLSDLATGTYVAETVALVEQKVSVSGTVTDESGNPLQGVVVSVDSAAVSVTTDAAGKYAFEVGTFQDVTLKFTLENYTAADVKKTVEELAAAAAHTVDIEMIATNQVKYITLSGVVTNVNGPVAGAVVTVDGNSELTATTDTQGRFTIENFAAIDGKLTIVKAGYLTAQIVFAADHLEENATAYDFGNVDMPLEYAAMYGLIADKADGFAAFKGYVTRSAVGFEFKFVGQRAFAGRLELFVDTKDSSADNARNATDYRFDLNADGTLGIDNWGGTNTVKPEAMQYTVVNADSVPELYFTLPYAFLGVSATEVIGIAAGQWSTTANDWDGWDNFALTGVNGAPFVKPEWTEDYVRIGAHNELYAANSNHVVVDLSSYQIHFGTGATTDTPAGGLGINVGNNADDFYGKVAKRDENGVTFTFVTTGNFGVNNGSNEKEMILIYFDTGAVSTGGWTPDYLIKIASDGTVYGSNGTGKEKGAAWWSATEADKIGTATITKENGVTTIEYTVGYETVGIAATDVFGVAMREASHNAGDHMLYDPWYDCYFNGGTVGIDAADCAQFIRVAADGTLYKDNNNNAND